MRNTVGIPARKDDFFKRDFETQKIQDRLAAGNNIQIAAPRRVGKTSILFYLLDNNVDGYLYVFVDMERVNNEQDFYKKLFKEIIKSEGIASSRRLQRLLNSGSKFLKKIKSLTIAGTSIEFGEGDKEPDYYEELTNFLSGFELEEDRKLILLIDEFPQAIINILDANDGDSRKAIQLLQSNRELRLNPDISQKVQFIYTGSIGLNHTVASLNASAFVNDLSTVEIEPLSVAEGKQLIMELMLHKAIKIDEGAIDHLIQKIHWLIPFHIQLAIQEMGELCRVSKRARMEEVDKTFNNIVANRNNNHFEHYYSRLKAQFKKEAYRYAEALLQDLAIKEKITSAEMYDQAVGFGVQDQYRQILEILVYDGYINNVGDKNTYQFNSPIVRLWWQRFVCK